VTSSSESQKKTKDNVLDTTMNVSAPPTPAEEPLSDDPEVRARQRAERRAARRAANAKNAAGEVAELKKSVPAESTPVKKTAPKTAKAESLFDVDDDGDDDLFAPVAKESKRLSVAEADADLAAAEAELAELQELQRLDDEAEAVAALATTLAAEDDAKVAAIEEEERLEAEAELAAAAQAEAEAEAAVAMALADNEAQVAAAEQQELLDAENEAAEAEAAAQAEAAAEAEKEAAVAAELAATEAELASLGGVEAEAEGVAMCHVPYDQLLLLLVVNDIIPAEWEGSPTDLTEFVASEVAA
jgi:hypothetical protein